METTLIQIFGAITCVHANQLAIHTNVRVFYCNY